MPVEEFGYATIVSDPVFLFRETVSLIRHAQIFNCSTRFADRRYKTIGLGHGILWVVDTMLHEERCRYFYCVVDWRILLIKFLPAFFSDVAILDAVGGF